MYFPVNYLQFLLQWKEKNNMLRKLWNLKHIGGLGQSVAPTFLFLWIDINLSMTLINLLKLRTNLAAEI